jgi:hypothetical protein
MRYPRTYVSISPKEHILFILFQPVYMSVLQSKREQSENLLKCALLAILGHEGRVWGVGKNNVYAI